MATVSWRTAWDAYRALRRWRRLARLAVVLRPLEGLAWALAVCGCLTVWAPRANLEHFKVCLSPGGSEAGPCA
jgi:hypothetical protein